MWTKASPELIQAFDHTLDDDALNKRQYRTLSKKNPEKIAEVYDGAYLYKMGRKYFVLDDIQKKVTYYMRWEERNIFGHRAAYQVIVWRDQATTDVRGLAAEVFYDLLFEEHELIVTDRLQSPFGKRFWIDIVAAAFKEGYPVYMVDLVNKIKNPMNSVREILDKSEYIWPKHEVGKARLLCIAKTKIW